MPTAIVTVLVSTVVSNGWSFTGTTDLNGVGELIGDISPASPQTLVYGSAVDDLSIPADALVTNAHFTVQVGAVAESDPGGGASGVCAPLHNLIAGGGVGAAATGGATDSNSGQIERIVGYDGSPSARAEFFADTWGIAMDLGLFGQTGALSQTTLTTTSAQIEVTYDVPIGPPVQLTIDPPSGPIAGGTPFTITGTGFQSGLAIAFDGIQATDVVFISPTEATGVSPAHAAGVVPIVVANPDEQTCTTPLTYTYFVSPNIQSSPPWQTPGQWAIHQLDILPTRQGPSKN